MMEQRWTLHCPIAAEEMLPLKNIKKGKNDLSISKTIVVCSMYGNTLFSPTLNKL